MIENEFKIMLTEEQYNAIHAMYEWDSEKRQVNSYYDDPELTCSERHITVRVREVLPPDEASGGGFRQRRGASR